jgi:coproporphyrinogen III oxidase
MIYFGMLHRNEARGLGGLFFDYCKETEEMKMENWLICQRSRKQFSRAYTFQF